jgi:hypothetical protein
MHPLVLVKRRDALTGLQPESITSSHVVNHLEPARESEI